MIAATVTALVTVGFPFDDELEYMNLNPVRKGLVKRPEDGQWPSYNNFALEKATVAACPIPINYVRLAQGQRA